MPLKGRRGGMGLDRRFLADTEGEVVGDREGIC